LEMLLTPTAIHHHNQNLAKNIRSMDLAMKISRAFALIARFKYPMLIP